MHYSRTGQIKEFPNQLRIIEPRKIYRSAMKTTRVGKLLSMREEDLIKLNPKLTEEDWGEWEENKHTTSEIIIC